MSRNGAMNESDKPWPAGVVAKPPAEYTRSLKGLAITPLGSPDAYAPSAGFADGWPIAYSPKAGWATLTHCYGSVGVGRDLSPDTGTGGELYAVIGQAPRHLDRNIALVGRVIEGIDRLSSLPRGTEALGFYKDKAQYVPIASIRAGQRHARRRERPSFEYMDTASATFAALPARPRQPARRFLHPSGGRRRPVQRAGAGAEEGLSAQAAQAWRVAVLVLDDHSAPLCERMLASASGRAVVQKAHSADTRPMSQWVRPQPGQWLTSCSR